jgi:hypothetical protein
MAGFTTIFDDLRGLLMFIIAIVTASVHIFTTLMSMIAGFIESMKPAMNTVLGGIGGVLSTLSGGILGLLGKILKL